MNNYVSLEQKRKLINELKELENKLNKTINIKKKIDILENISMYCDIIESVYSEYDELEYYQKLDEKHKISSFLMNKVQEMNIKSEIKDVGYDYDFYKVLTRNLGKSLQNNKIDPHSIISNNKLVKSSLENFIELVNIYFPKDFSNFIYKEVKNNRLFLTDYCYCGGICFPLTPYNKHLYYYLCEVSNGITYYDFTTIIHELTHGFVDNITTNSKFYDEVYSRFNEFKINNIIYNSKGALFDNKKFDLYILKELLHDNKNLKENLKFIRKMNNGEYNINDYDIYYSEENCIYLISYILGLKLYYQDLEDTELAHYNINKIYKNEYNDIDDINKLEKISKDEILSCELVKRYIKEINSKGGSLKK